MYIHNLTVHNTLAFVLCDLAQVLLRILKPNSDYLISSPGTFFCFSQVCKMVNSSPDKHLKFILPECKFLSVLEFSVKKDFMSSLNLVCTFSTTSDFDIHFTLLNLGKPETLFHGKYRNVLLFM